MPFCLAKEAPNPQQHPAAYPNRLAKLKMLVWLKLKKRPTLSHIQPLRVRHPNKNLFKGIWPHNGRQPNNRFLDEAAPRQ